MKELISVKVNNPHKVDETPKFPKNLLEAKHLGGSFIVFEADYGGVIYAVVSASHVTCSESDLDLVEDYFFSESYVGLNDEKEGHLIYYIRDSINNILGKNEKHYVVDNNLWIHTKYSKTREKVESILFQN